MRRDAKAHRDVQRLLDPAHGNSNVMLAGVEAGEGDDDGELARWRSAAFVAVSGLVDFSHSDQNWHVAFKARTEMVDPETGEDLAPTDGIYLRKGPNAGLNQPLVVTGSDGTIIDPDALDPETEEALPVTEMGIERDGFRGNSIAITVSMGTEEAGWAGVYLTRICE